jgi:hypothetical protein
MSRFIKKGSKFVGKPKEVSVPFVTVHVKALQVVDNENGTFSIQLSATIPTTEQLKVLEGLFPNLIDKAYELLSREALLAAMATPTEVLTPPSDYNNSPPEKDTFAPYDAEDA